MIRLFSSSFLTIGLVCTTAMFQSVNAETVRYGGQADNLVVERVADKDWQVTLGAGAFYQPEYEGADEYEVSPLPYFNVKYKDIVEFTPRALDVNLLRHGGFKAGAGIGVNFGREEDDADRLDGLGDIDPTAEGRLFVGYDAQSFDAALTFAHDLGDAHEGYTIDAEIGMNHSLTVGDKAVFLRPSAGVTYASEDYMQTFFGIDAAQSGRSGLAQYQSDAGFKDVSAGLTAFYMIDEHWSVRALTEYSYLLEEASDSPIVEDENQFSAGLFIAYTF